MPSIAEALDEFHEAQEQVGFAADRIPMSKTDLVSQEESRESLEQAEMNPRAPIKKVHFGDAPLDEVLDIRGFNPNATLQLDPQFLVDSHHEHHDEVESFVFKSERLDGQKLEHLPAG